MPLMSLLATSLALTSISSNVAEAAPFAAISPVTAAAITPLPSALPDPNPNMADSSANGGAAITPEAPAESQLLLADAAPAKSAPLAAATPAAPVPPAAADDSFADPAITEKRGNIDPFEPINRISYAITQPIDAVIFRPAAMIYKAVLPKPLRDGARNALANIYAPTVLANDLMQLRPKRAWHTLKRFLINSTIGLGGLIDVAKKKPYNLPGHANSFADTLGFYGVGHGPYIFVPVFGPTGFRGIVGSAVDAFTQPLLLDTVSTKKVEILAPKKKVTFFTKAISVSRQGQIAIIVAGLDQRAESDDALKAIKAQSVDPYAALRSLWLQTRAGEIAALKSHDDEGGPHKPSSALDDPLKDPSATEGPTTAEKSPTISPPPRNSPSRW